MIAVPLLLLAKVNLAGAAAICVVLALRKLARHRLGASAAYGLWLLPPLVVAASLAPARQVMVTAPHIQLQVQPVLAPFSAPTAGDYSPLLLALWGMGVALSLIVLFERQRRFMVRLGRLTPSPDPRVLNAERPGVGPAVIGVLAPRIVLPADFEVQYDPAERAAILIHERGHIAAGHIQINSLVALIRCVCWFNPLVHIAAQALRLDQELTCDARVLTQFPAGRRAYGEALLRTQLNALPLPLGCYWPSSGAAILKERLVMLKMPTPNRRTRFAGGGLIIAATAVCAAAAWSAQPPEKVIAPAQVEVGGKLHARPFPAGQLAQATDPATTASATGKTTSPSGPPQVSVSNSVVRDYEPSKNALKPVVVTTPVVQSMPDGAAYAAALSTVGGHLPEGSKASMSCSVGKDGGLNDCSVLTQSNDDAGAVLLALALSMKMQPGLDRDGKPVDGVQVTVPMTYVER